MEEDKDKITVSETVTVDIGDYEKRNAFASYSTTIREGETADEAYDRADKQVMKRLKKKERLIREASEDDVDFETIEKLNYHKKSSSKKNKKKKSKK